MRVYWSRCGRGQGNFGDKLTPLLLKHFGVRCEWAPVERAELIGVGSVLEKVPENFKGAIWTTGFMHEQSRRTFPQARLLALRGCLTRERVENAKPVGLALGDAGLLCHLFHSAKPKRHKLGIIPHFVDADDPVLASIAHSSSEITVIDICGDTLDVIARVGQCEHIVSSSLHGLILADSLDIPNRWIELNRGAETVTGGGFKFRDYYSIYKISTPVPDGLNGDDNLESILSRVGDYSRPGIERLKETLLQTLAAITTLQPISGVEESRYERTQRKEWATRLENVRQLLESTLPADSTVVLADEDQLGAPLQFQRVFPFTECEGRYWGPPANDEAALSELSRLTARGADYFAIAFPSFWIIEQFPRFAARLRKEFACRVERDDVLVFQLRDGK